MSTPREEHSSNAQQSQVDPARAEDSPRFGRTGEGTASIVPHLRDQEEQHKPLSDH